MEDTEEIERKAKTIGMQRVFFDEAGIGLTKREWFAGMALQVLLANPGNTLLDKCADYAVFSADAILKRLAESDGAK
jgi:hypothetical protein